MSTDNIDEVITNFMAKLEKSKKNLPAKEGAKKSGGKGKATPLPPGVAPPGKEIEPPDEPVTEPKETTDKAIFAFIQSLTDQNKWTTYQAVEAAVLAHFPLLHSGDHLTLLIENAMVTSKVIHDEGLPTPISLCAICGKPLTEDDNFEGIIHQSCKEKIDEIDIHESLKEMMEKGEYGKIKAMMAEKSEEWLKMLIEEQKLDMKEVEDSLGISKPVEDYSVFIEKLEGLVTVLADTINAPVPDKPITLTKIEDGYDAEVWTGTGGVAKAVPISAPALKPTKTLKEMQAELYQAIKNMEQNAPMPIELKITVDDEVVSLVKGVVVALLASQVGAAMPKTVKKKTTKKKKTK